MTFKHGEKARGGWDGRLHIAKCSCGMLFARRRRDYPLNCGEECRREAQRIGSRDLALDGFIGAATWGPGSREKVLAAGYQPGHTPALKGKKMGAEARANVSAGHVGKPWSTKQRRAIPRGMKRAYAEGRRVSPMLLPGVAAKVAEKNRGRTYPTIECERCGDQIAVPQLEKHLSACGMTCPAPDGEGGTCGRSVYKRGTCQTHWLRLYKKKDPDPYRPINAKLARHSPRQAV